MKYTLIFFSFFFFLNSFAQKNKRFSEVPQKIKSYRLLAQTAWNNNDSTKALSYDDSTKNSIVNSTIENYDFRKVNGEVLHTKNVKKPIFLLTSASWCGPCMAEIKPLNKIVEQYFDSVQFIILFWDTKDKVEKLSNRYNPKIALIPTLLGRTNTDDNSIDIDGFKHVGGYPATYLIWKKKIVHYSEGAATTSVSKLNSEGKVETVVIATEEEVFKANYQLLKSEIEKILYPGRQTDQQ